jgi:hypothetical protein
MITVEDVEQRCREIIGNHDRKSRHQRNEANCDEWPSDEE